jgi:hypothetical protein
MTELEQRLKEQLFPKKAFTGESIEQEVLKPLNELSEVINEVREKIGLELLREAVAIASEASVAESLNGFKLQLKEILDLGSNYEGLTSVLNELNDKVDALSVNVSTYLEQAKDVADLEAATLMKLNAYLDKAV